MWLTIMNTSNSIRKIKIIIICAILLFLIYFLLLLIYAWNEKRSNVVVQNVTQNLSKGNETIKNIIKYIFHIYV